MYTDADRYLDDARRAVEEAIEKLSPIVVTRSVFGWEEYNSEFRMKLQASLHKLLDVREEIGTV